MNLIIANITMKSAADGGRPCGFWTNYRPHLVPKGTEDYLGVSVTGISESEAVLPGTTRRVSFELIYPDVDYGGLCSGASFEIREGQRVVGDGVVAEIIDEASFTP
jgi:translation elongation factor EF-Tu-like GTPase